VTGEHTAHPYRLRIATRICTQRMNVLRGEQSTRRVMIDTRREMLSHIACQHREGTRRVMIDTRRDAVTHCVST